MNNNMINQTKNKNDEKFSRKTLCAILQIYIQKYFIPGLNFKSHMYNKVINQTENKSDEKFSRKT